MREHQTIHKRDSGVGVETVFMLFGIELKRSPAKGQGVWEQVYVERGLDGSAQLRVMRTPSLFVLRQKAAAQ